VTVLDYAAQYGYLTAAQVAARLGIKQDSVYRMVMNPGFPRPAEYLGRTPLWREADIRWWRQNHPARARRERDPQG
jgi:predicted DNA-binding transcriptional regulator AlpA